MGRATAELFGREGAKVVVADRDTEGGTATVAAIKTAGGAAAFVRYDQTGSDETLKRMVDESIAAFGRIDILHNHAGTLLLDRDGPLHLIEADLLDFYHALNVRGPMLIAKWVLHHMLERGGGTIVLTASDTAMMGIPAPGAATRRASRRSSASRASWPRPTPRTTSASTRSRPASSRARG
jgi:NAD(P)-dependent dehydrogenase (short-subunit alcohol dehydrogenase family)